MIENEDKLLDLYAQDFAATIIQSRFRCYQKRRKYRRMRRAARIVQRIWRAFTKRRVYEGWAARTIQRCWRSHSSRAIFGTYRTLLAFRQRGDPRQLLRSINPREASLLDAAGGAHVRFRLGGASFPPEVFYKIFTHRPVTDICAFCPRNYAGPLGGREEDEASPSRIDPQLLASSSSSDYSQYMRSDGTIGVRDTSNWYRRQEHNGWRSIAVRALEDPEEHMREAAAAAAAASAFHFSRIVRRQEQARIAKQRKLDWLRKMYRLGDARIGPEPVDEEGKPDEEEEDSVLLDWTVQLDFDHYLRDWKALGTSQASDDQGPERELPYIAALPTCVTDILRCFSEAKANIPCVS